MGRRREIKEERERDRGEKVLCYRHLGRGETGETERKRVRGQKDRGGDRERQRRRRQGTLCQATWETNRIEREIEWKDRER